jgi:hypothetical protein
VTDLLTCLIIGPINYPGSTVRAQADRLRREIIDPVLHQFGYSPALRADDLSTPGRVNDQVVRLLLSADLVIADLTDGNPNACYELAIRHATGKPFVHMTAGRGPIPFDLADQRAIVVDLTEPDSIGSAITELTATVRLLTQPNQPAARTALYGLRLLHAEDYQALMAERDRLRAALETVVDRGGQLTDDDVAGLIGAAADDGQRRWAKELSHRAGVWLPGGR